MNPTRALYDRLPAGFRSWLRSSLPDALLRWYAHRNTEVYLISYPKCGRTWLRLMMGRAISRHFQLAETEDVLFLSTNRRYHPQAPRISVVHDDRPMLKSPEELTQSKEKFRGKRVIFLARDPRDVIVSSYFEMKNRGRMFGENPYETRQPVYDGDLREFIDRQVGGFRTILAYYNIWARNRGIPQGFLVVRYEDLKANPRQELRRILDFMGLAAIKQEVIDEAVVYASFENMRKMEEEGQFQSGMLKPTDPKKEETYKTRKGKIHGYLEHLSKDEIHALDTELLDNLDEYFGYTPTGEYIFISDRI